MEIDPYKITIDQFEQLIPTDLKARQFFEQIRWGGFPRCPFCGDFKSYPNGCGTRYKCANPNCRKKYSVSIQSLLNYSKVGLKTWLLSVFLFQKTRKRILSTALSGILEVSPDTAFSMKRRLEAIFEPISAEGKSGSEIFKEACNNFFILKDKYIPKKGFDKNFWHIDGILDITQHSTYDRLVLYARIRMFFCPYITVTFLSPEEIISEVFIRLSDYPEQRTDGSFIVKLINRTIAKLWYDYQKSNPLMIKKLRNYQKEWKHDARKYLKNYYIAQIESQRLIGKGLEPISTDEIREDNNLKSEIKNRLIRKRKNKTFD